MAAGSHVIMLQEGAVQIMEVLHDYFAPDAAG